MTDTPDPKTVREIVRKHIESGRDDIGTTVVKHFGSGALDDEAFGAWEYAVHQARWHSGAQITVTWPDEQPQDGAVRTYPDSHSPWSQWLASQASGNVLTAKQVSRWLHSQEVPEPGSAAVAGKALGGVVIGALHAAGHGGVADGLTAEAEQPQDDGDVRAPRCPECGATPPNWRPDDVECEICAADLEDTIDDLAEKIEQKQADPDIRYLTQATKMIAAHVRELAAENARLRAALEARDAKAGEQR